MDLDDALKLVRHMISVGVGREDAIRNNVIPVDYQQQIRKILGNEDIIILEPAACLVSGEQREDWLNQLDRSSWYYWKALRNYLLIEKGWNEPSIRSLDESTDRILIQFAPPLMEHFDIRGLVIGYIQSGKTANYTALIAKAADVGYRLVIVLSGIDNGLRLQTQIRLNKELVGYHDGNHPNAVTLPNDVNKRWVQFTTEDLNGDFRSGNLNNAILGGIQPILLVIKKNKDVLDRLIEWLNQAPQDSLNSIPILLIDDEADQASIDTRGGHRNEDSYSDDEPTYESPSVINGLIRKLLKKFNKKVYVAYTATPFANILIPHDTFTPEHDDDLYPRDFIVDLPKPENYYGAEELFGRHGDDTDTDVDGMDVIRYIPENDIDTLNDDVIPPSLETALIAFVLAGAGRTQRGQGHLPCTMLIHGSHRIERQNTLKNLIEQRFKEFKDEWRYDRARSLRNLLLERWEDEFRPITKSIDPSQDVPFDRIEPYITPFFEETRIRVVNSSTGEILNYEKEPKLKAIAVGGNKLSRGLTLEGLLVSYFFRSSKTYDTLLQMGRWFGFRKGYVDLTRIFMTPGMAGCFADLAYAEYQVRQDIRRYEAENITPRELGVRIIKHPTMLVTSRLKQRFADELVIEQSYSNKIEQTVRFPFQHPNKLSDMLENNLLATREFLQALYSPRWQPEGPIWFNIKPQQIVEFLQKYMVDFEIHNVTLPLIIDYIRKANDAGELISWTISVRGRNTMDNVLGAIDLGLSKMIPMISRTRLIGDSNSLGVITNPGDETIGLSEEQMERVKEIQESRVPKLGINPAARQVRDPKNGLLLIYPVSKKSGHERSPTRRRKKIYDNPEDQQSKDIICLAISFPRSNNTNQIWGQYIVGTAGWRPL